eukprot:1003557-Rhodomonas_salina.1
MVKASAECAGSSHLGKDCGNKEVGKMKKKGNWPAVHLDVFPGMGLGLRATKYIAAGEVVGPYYGRVQSMPKRQLRRGHNYLVCSASAVFKLRPTLCGHALYLSEFVPSQPPGTRPQ